VLTAVGSEIASSVVAGTWDALAYAFPNVGVATYEGWPKPLQGSSETAPAGGDIDRDGANELVFVTSSTLEVFDVNQTGTLFAGWPMDGHDSRRSACYSCAEDVLTSVESAAPPEGRLRFAEPYPNPSAETGTTFSFALSEPAAATLEIYDVAGRRVRALVRLAEAPGERSVFFDGRDASGGRLASGVYFARLSVRGPASMEHATRKFSVLR